MPTVFLNQARTWFLKIDIVRTSVCVCVRVCLCMSAPRAIKNYSREMKSEKLRRASYVTSKEEQGNAVFAVHYTAKAV